MSSFGDQQRPLDDDGFERKPVTYTADDLQSSAEESPLHRSQQNDELDKQFGSPINKSEIKDK